MSDVRIQRPTKREPDYVGTRYASHGMARTELMVLAVRAQPVAAEALRRVSSNRDLASKLEADPNISSRPALW